MRENERRRNEIGRPTAGALLALLSEPSIRDAAARAKLSEATLYRYLAEPDFSARYREARRRAVVDHLTTRLQAKAEASARVLSEIAEDEGKLASFASRPRWVLPGVRLLLDDKALVL